MESRQERKDNIAWLAKYMQSDQCRDVVLMVRLFGPYIVVSLGSLLRDKLEHAVFKVADKNLK